MTYNIFNQYIHHSDNICQNCFSRIRETEPCDSDLRDEIVSKTENAEEVFQQDYEPSKSRTIHCSACGSDMGYMNRPVSMDRAFELVDNLAERINEFEDLEVDNLMLRKEIRELKGRSRNQAHDNSLYSEAVFRSVAVDN